MGLLVSQHDPSSILSGRSSARVVEKTIAEPVLPLQARNLPTPTTGKVQLGKRATFTGHAALAAASGMKPAAVASLPFPTKALSKNETISESRSSECGIQLTLKAAEYIDANWKTTGSISKFIDFVVDPLGGSDIVLRVLYPKGSYSNDVPGGVSAILARYSL